jgi:hypothetical protein
MVRHFGAQMSTPPGHGPLYPASADN